MAPGSDISTWRTGHAAGIVLERPQAINVLTLDMVTDISAALDDLAEDDSVRTVVIRGEGRGLCAGGDMKAIRQLVLDDPLEARRFFAREYEMNARIDAYPKPIVALMDGIVMGGGIGLSSHASHRIVTEASVLAMPEVAIGFVPDVGATWLLARAPGHLGLFVGLTGARLQAADAIHLGLADHLVASDDIDDLIDAVTREEPSAAIPRFASSGPDVAPLAQDQAWIDDAFGADTVVDIIGRLARTDDVRAVEARDRLVQGSPTALVATFEAVRYADTAIDLFDCLRNEFRLGTALIGMHDFLEGTRAVLIDKDGAAHWDPAPLTHEIEAQVSAWIGSIEPTDDGPRYDPASGG